MDAPPRSRRGLYIGIGIGALILIVAVVVIVILLGRSSPAPSNNPPPGGTGSTGFGGTGSDELSRFAACRQTCTTIFTTCLAENRHGVVLIGGSCPGSCSAITTVPIEGCRGPLCNQGSCPPQAALYSHFVSGNPQQQRLYCGRGDQFPPAFYPPDNCPNPLGNPSFLGSLLIRPSNRSQGQYRPIYITTLRRSVYDPNANTQDVTGPTTISDVLANPFVLKAEPNGFGSLPPGTLRFVRFDTLVAQEQVAQATWIYDSNSNRLLLYQDRFNATPNVATFFPEFNDGCGGLAMNTFGVNDPSGTLVYNGNIGLFTNQDGTPFNVDVLTDVPATNIFCTEFGDRSRWYSIDADPFQVSLLTRRPGLF